MVIHNDRLLFWKDEFTSLLEFEIKLSSVINHFINNPKSNIYLPMRLIAGVGENLTNAGVSHANTNIGVNSTLYLFEISFFIIQ